MGNFRWFKARLPRLLGWLEETRPDVLCLQETKTPDAGFPVKEVAELGYEAALYGTGRWNGVAILSRAGLDDVRRGFPGEPGFPDAEARAISATCAGCRVWSVYVPNGRALDSPHLAYKLSWLAALRDALAAELSPDAGGSRLAVCGDFNIDRESSLFGEFRAATGLADAFGGACPPTFRAEYLPAGATPHCIDFILTAGEVKVETAALVFAGKEPLGYVSDHIGLRARLFLTPSR